MIVSIRPATDNDLGLILNSWLKSYRNADATRHVPNDIYYSQPFGHKGLIMHLLDKSEVVIACNPEDGEAVYGWLCHEWGGGDWGHIVHFVYVKALYRRAGVAKALLTAAGFDKREPFVTTHETPAVRGRFDYVFNPYLGAT